MPKNIGDAERYLALGVSATKADVYAAIEALPSGISAHTFCRVLPDIFQGDGDYVVVSHADGAGSKSILAYLHHRLTNSVSAFANIAQDAVVMNLDDMLCVGAMSPFVLTSIVNRNAARIDGEVLRAVINGTQEFAEHLRAFGVDIHFAGGETADVGDIVQTLLVDANMVARFPLSNVQLNRITGNLTIVGLESGGAPSIYESAWNSGIGCNGLSFARHELLSQRVVQSFPEIAGGPNLHERAYVGPFDPFDQLPGGSCTVLDALLSPTRTFAPVMRQAFATHKGGIHAVVHNTGGGHTKCLRFASGCHIHKDIKSIPAIFKVIQSTSALGWPEMAKIFNLGIRMEIYCEKTVADDLIAIAKDFGVGAHVIGETISGDAGSPATLTLTVDGDEYVIQ